MILNPLEINILYYSAEGREVQFTDLVNQSDVMDSKDYQPSNFWGVLGGFEVTLNGHFTIFSNCNFYCLVKATSFLLSSLYWLHEKKSAWFDQDEDFPNSLSVSPTPNTVVKLRRMNPDEILFSFTATDSDYVFKRGDRYFEGIKINIYDWIRQVNIALAEYFEILSSVLDRVEGFNKTASIMKEYKEVWRDISA